MFNNSKYTKYYNKIISNAKIQIRSKKIDYYESHHIIPKSLGGSNKKENIVLLTAKEHFICHLLLTKMCILKKHEYKMFFAFNKMSRISPNQRRYVSNSYHIHKKSYSRALSEKQTGRKMSEEFKEKTRQRLLGTNLSEETKRKISENHYDVSGVNNPNYGKHWSQEWKDRHSNIMKEKMRGENNPMFGKTHSVEVRQKLSEHGKNKWTPEMKAKMIETRKLNKLKKFSVSSSI